jgi:peptidyl-prolyl cis-trans isomerase SurA
MRTITFAVIFALAGSLSAAAQTPQSRPPVAQQAVPPPATQAAPPPGTQAAPPVPAGQSAPITQGIQFDPSPKTELLEQILVKVNGEIITKTDLEARQVLALRQKTQQMNDDELRKAIAQVTPDLLADFVDELLLLQRGKELGYKVTDDQFKRVLENIRKENKLEDDVQFAAALKQEGISVEGLRKNLEKQMIINQVQQAEVAGKIGVSEDEARAYYDTHKSEFTTTATITLRELLVAVPGDPKAVNAAADEAAKAKADAALKRARAGEAFPKLVTEYSEAPSKANGGLVGPLTVDELDAGIRKLIQPLKPGGVTDVFRTANGYAILLLDSATTPQLESFEGARDKIADKVYASRRTEEFTKYLRKLRSEAIIEWKNDEMRKLWILATSDAAQKSPGLPD